MAVFRGAALHKPFLAWQAAALDRKAENRNPYRERESSVHHDLHSTRLLSDQADHYELDHQQTIWLR